MFGYGTQSENISNILANYQGWAMGIRSFQKNATFLHSFTFFIKERGVLCVLLKERCTLFWFHKSYKNDRISQKKG